MYLPSYMHTKNSITVELLLENHSEVGVHMTVSQKKVCDCKPVMTAVSFSRSKLEDRCPHKNQICISPNFCDIKAQGYVILTVDVSYNTVEYVQCLFMLSLIPEDLEEINITIDLYLRRTIIPEDTHFIDSVEPKENDNFIFNMEPVFIGDVYPFVQAFTLYNNTMHTIHYEIDEKALYGTPFKYVGKSNTISPLKTHALLFTFLPNRCQVYEAEIELKINNIPRTIILRGTGASSVVKENENNGKFVLRKEKLVSLSPSPVYISKSHINVGPIKSGCTQRHVMFFNNNSKDIINFHWNSARLSEVVEMLVHPKKGAVEPGEVVECRLVVHSKGLPCYLALSLTCVFASFSKYARAIHSKQKYMNDKATCADYFIITESGMKNVELIPPLEEWPQKNYLTVSVILNVKNESLEKGDFLPLIPSSFQITQNREPITNITDEHKLIIVDVLEKILWEALNDTCKNINIKHDKPLARYIQLRDLTGQKDVAVPSQITQTVLEDILYSTWQDVFHLTSRHSSEFFRRTLISQLQTRKGVCSEDGVTQNANLISTAGLLNSQESNSY